MLREHWHSHRCSCRLLSGLAFLECLLHFTHHLSGRGLGHDFFVPARINSYVDVKNAQIFIIPATHQVRVHFEATHARAEPYESAFDDAALLVFGNGPADDGRSRGVGVVYGFSFADDLARELGFGELAAKLSIEIVRERGAQFNTFGFLEM